MVQNEWNHTLGVLLVLAIVFSIGGIFLNYALIDSVKIPVVTITGKVTGTGTATLTDSGTAGITISDSNVDYGSGYYQGNGTCAGSPVQDYATLDSNITYGNGNTLYQPDPGNSAYCWVNTTAFMGTRDRMTIINSGNTLLNVSAIADQNGEDWLCGGSVQGSPGNCAFTNSAALYMWSIAPGNESLSCGGGVYANNTVGYEQAVGPTTNVTVGLCDNLNYQDAGDTINIFFNASIPKDATVTSSAKTLTITYQGLAI